MKFLVVKLGAIGDAIMALPMVEAIRQKDPSARITWVCGREVEPLLRAFGKIDELIVVDEAELLKGNPVGRIGVMLGLWAKLFLRRYDRVITGYADPRYRLLTRTVLAKCRRHFDRKKARPHPIPGRYFVDEYVRLATDVDDSSAPVFRIPEVQWPISSELRRKIENLKGQKVIAIAPGGARNVMRDNALRRWPLEYYRELAGRLIGDGAKVLLLGAPSDLWVVPSFEGMGVANFVGQTHLVELVGLLGTCDLLITHDSGPMHAAVLAGTPLVALFGPTDPRWFADGTRRKTKILWGGEDLACRPCYDGKNFAPCENNLCLKGIKVEQVYAATKELL